jgi:hypothetical protein
MLKDKHIGTGVLGTALALAACLLLSSSCAKISEPKPPHVRIPKAAIDLKAHQLSDAVVLTVSKPTQNTDGSEATLEHIELFRLSVDGGRQNNPESIPEDQFMKQAAHILSIPSAGLSTYLQETVFVLKDKLDLPDATPIGSRSFRYAVLFTNSKGEAAGFSNQALIALIPLPGPPSGLAITVTEGAVHLAWTKPTENLDGSRPPRLYGFNIYKSEDAQKIPATPINDHPVPESEFEDRDFEFDKTYYYAVQTVANLKDPYAVSLLSDAKAIETRDAFPPAPPENFHALPDNDGILLLWTPSASADVAGYRIYRRDVESASRLPLEQELITFLSYRDRSAPRGQPLEYTIQAVDKHGNESVPARTESETR